MTKPKLKKVTPKASEVKAPEEKVPEVKAPEVKAPEVKAPEVKAPKAPEEKKEVSFRITRANEVFKSHHCEVVYFTSDDTCFVNQSYAHMHAANLADTTVSPVTKNHSK